jgi:hypothetical protein
MHWQPYERWLPLMRLKKICAFLTLDFQGAFDAKSHEYMEAILLQIGYSEIMTKRIMGLYDGATNSVQINGYISAPSTYIPLSGKDAQ